MIIERFVGWMDSAPAGTRAQAVDALARAWSVLDEHDERREAAEAAMTCVLDDQDEDVRHALASAIAANPQAPRHLVLALATDNWRVSLPVLMLSPVLIDGELADMLPDTCEEQQVAIACRSRISRPLSLAIARHGSAEACLALVMNEAARIGADAFHEIAVRHGDTEDLRRCLLARHDIGMHARVLLIEKYALSLLDAPGEGESESRRKARLQEACDKAVITFAAQVTDTEVAELVEALIDAGRLTAAFLLRTLCMGNIALFAAALSRLSGQPLARVERILKDGGANAFTAIYLKAGLPSRACEVFMAAVDAWRHQLDRATSGDYADLPYRVTQEVLATYRGSGEEGVDGLLILLRRICADAARDKARHRVEQMMLAAELAALPAPQDEADSQQAAVDAPDLSDAEFMEFAIHLADELAEMALESEAELRKAQQRAVPANTDIPPQPPLSQPAGIDFEDAIILPKRNEQTRTAAAA